MCILSFKNWKINTLSSKIYKLRKLRNLLARKLSFLSLYTFLECVFIFQFLNDKMHNYVKQNIIVYFIIQKLINKHIFLKNIETEKAKEPLILTEREERRTRYFPPSCQDMLVTDKWTTTMEVVFTCFLIFPQNSNTPGMLELKGGLKS